ncbi:50S ribosomal protein L5 [Waddlia chondrophila 2032/99]|uniref:Large ribosomal subunit protein uL5 n=2 Tax=Waddlia chondrophila TaxID=71667 RepID=D6YRZ4_WADCW|nr:50S ribosomal protein L5 [Waddlia chondrophila]ADI38839.1 50S ribosomal protein L5 [Waddlia chondrophila WSU 86-1044]CCB90387.1 50S ribosomal protein L5 [Waddlia chondrophila 2032/99]
MSRLKKYYREKVKEELQKKFDCSNPMTIPTLRKVVINMGIAEAAKDKNAIQDCINELSLISGQKPILTKAKKSISNFKLREGMPIGLKVTLRGDRMFDFMDRFFNIVCPRIRDFRGFNPKGDGSGNYTLGLDDQQIFPELNLDEVKRTQGMHITFVTTAKSDEQCIELLRLLGLPFKKLPVSVTI